MKLTKTATTLLLSGILLTETSSQENEAPSKEPKSPIRNTTTGKGFEQLIAKQLTEAGYAVESQVQVGTRPNSGRHYIDLVVKKDQHSFLVSLKWQQSSGTAEQKIPYEMICLSEALKQSRGAHNQAFLVLGGEGWTLKEFYLSGGLDRHLSLDQPVELLSAETFLERAKNDQLWKEPSQKEQK